MSTKGNRLQNHTFNRINTNDIWLLSFFAIHFVYIALCVFLPLPQGDEKSVLDVVMRTSAAVLVGYFLSKNFMSEKISDKTLAEKSVRLTIQYNIVGIVGFFSLTIILTVRYSDFISLPYNVISQLRDFYLASIAFLMGTAK